MGVFKNGFFFFFIFSFFQVTSAYSINLPFEKTEFYILHYEFDNLSYTVDQDSAAKIKSCFFNENDGDFHIASKHNVSYIQIFDPEGYLFFQLPIENSEIHLDMDDFEIGSYEIIFKFADFGKMTRSTLIKKQ